MRTKLSVVLVFVMVAAVFAAVCPRNDGKDHDWADWTGWKHTNFQDGTCMKMRAHTCRKCLTTNTETEEYPCEPTECPK